jgi:hypothetical protein
MHNETYKFYITEYKNGKTYLDNFEEVARWEKKLIEQKLLYLLK